MSEQANKIVTEEDKRYCERFWKVMPFFYKEELIKGAYPDLENAAVDTLKTYIPNVRAMYKGLVAEELLDLRERWEYCIQHEIESPWDVLELFKPQHFFKRNKKEAFLDYLKHKGISDNKKINESVHKYLTETPPNFNDILNRYWQKHNPTYLDWLDELLLQVSESKLKDIRTKKNAILIAAMNETELEKVFDACRNAYGDDFEKDMAFIVFHNYKKKNAVKEEVWRSVENVQSKGRNVLLIHQEVPDYFFDAPAKKVLLDFYLRLDMNIDSKLFLLDADVLNLTISVFKEAINIVSNANRYLVASPEFDYDQDIIHFNYPVLKLIFDVRRDLDFFAVREEANFNYQMAYGMFTCLDLGSLLLIGGLKPSTYVDGFLTNEIRLYGDSIYEGNDLIYFNYPLYPLSLSNHFVYVNSSRERISLGQGQEAFARWSGDSDHANITTEFRSNIENLNNNIPEFSEYNEINIVKALNKAWLFMYKFRPSDDVKISSNEINHSKRLIRVLKKYGIEIADANVDVVNNASFNLKTGEGDFMIRRINQIKIINEIKK
jgi:hypothetical protein